MLEACAAGQTNLEQHPFPNSSSVTETAQVFHKNPRNAAYKNPFAPPPHAPTPWWYAATNENLQQYWLIPQQLCSVHTAVPNATAKERGRSCTFLQLQKLLLLKILKKYTCFSNLLFLRYLNMQINHWLFSLFRGWLPSPALTYTLLDEEWCQFAKFQPSLMLPPTETVISCFVVTATTAITGFLLIDVFWCF